MRQNVDGYQLTKSLAQLTDWSNPQPQQLRSRHLQQLQHPQQHLQQPQHPQHLQRLQHLQQHLQRRLQPQRLLQRRRRHRQKQSFCYKMTVVMIKLQLLAINLKQAGHVQAGITTFRYALNFVPTGNRWNTKDARVKKILVFGFRRGTRVQSRMSRRITIRVFLNSLHKQVIYHYQLIQVPI